MDAGAACRAQLTEFFTGTGEDRLNDSKGIAMPTSPMLLSASAPAAPAARDTIALPAQDRETALRAAARAFEASFLAEMLRAAGVGRARAVLGGGAGEMQFAGFLADAQAARLVESGGIGLAEVIFEALKEREDVRKDA